MFRDIIFAIPEIAKGDASIVREELVPFFHFSTQFLSESLSSLTSSEEIRVVYSFWTAWVRHNAILPFALILMNTLSVFILFYAFYRIARHFSSKSPIATVVISSATAFLIYFILLYAKIAHFYTLIIGFSMFALSLSLIIEQLFLQTSPKQQNWRNIMYVSLLTIFNPAIHYHILFYLLLVIFIVLHILSNTFVVRKPLWPLIKGDLVYFLWIVALSLVPYTLYIIAMTGNSLESVSTQIPVNYWVINYTSVALPFVFSFDIVGHIDLYLNGDYSVQSPRIAAMVILFIASSVFLYKGYRSLTIQLKVLILVLYVSMLTAIWMALGYGSGFFSFHDLLSNFTIHLSSLNIFFGNTIEKIISVFIGVLRFPHRFQFIYFYIGGVLLTITLLWLKESIAKKINQKTIALILIVLITLIPFINKDYWSVLTSGDAQGFLAPYEIPKDLKIIKDKLKMSNNDKLFILPTLESGREIIKDGKRYSFLDKYLIYYLEQPSLYYGVGGNAENKILSYLVYKGIDENKVWWEEILSDNLNISHILYPKKLQNRPQGLTYMDDIYSKISHSLKNSKNYKKTYEGDDYILYERKEGVITNKATLVNMNWDNFLHSFNKTNPSLGRIYFPIQLKQYFEKVGKKELITDNLERSFYDLYISKSKVKYYPQTTRLPFTKELVASSNFTNNALSLDTLNNEKHGYNYLKEKIPTLTNLHSAQFIGLPAGGKQNITTMVNSTKGGNYRVLLHAASRSNTLDATLGNHRLVLQKIKNDYSEYKEGVDFTYFYADVYLNKGGQTLSVEGREEAAVAVELVGLVPQSDLPDNFSNISTSKIKIKATAEQNLYRVEIR